MKHDISAPVEATDHRLDSLKMAAAVLFVAAGLGGYYVFSGHSVLLRVVGLLVCVIVAVLIALRTERGRAAWGFIQEAQIEVRKVVWPTRDETLHTTAWVIATVVACALVMWVLDWFLGWGIRFVIGTGS